MRVGVIACCKTKLDRAAPARELYCSPLFLASMGWIERRVDQWVILSAKHGVVDPDQVLEPYDECLQDKPRRDRDAWATACRDELLRRFDSGTIYTTILGAAYSDSMIGFHYVEDVIDIWTRARKLRGMSNRAAAMSIGILIKHLKEGRGY